MKIVFYTNSFFPDPIGIAYYNLEWVESLTALGHQLLRPLAGLAEFALMNQFQVEHSRRRFDEMIDQGAVAMTVTMTDADRSTH